MCSFSILEIKSVKYVEFWKDLFFNLRYKIIYLKKLEKSLMNICEISPINQRYICDIPTKSHRNFSIYPLLLDFIRIISMKRYINGDIYRGKTGYSQYLYRISPFGDILWFSEHWFQLTKRLPFVNKILNIKKYLIYLVTIFSWT